MDVENGKGYPVFDAIKVTGTVKKAKRRFTYPDDAPNAYADRRRGGAPNRWVVTQPQTLVGTAGHLHPGGLYNDLKTTRHGKTKLLFRSEAKYWKPAGPVSWDVLMPSNHKN